MGETEAVERVVMEVRREARLHERAGNHVDEQLWFDAGEPDTDANVPLAEPAQVRPATEIPDLRAGAGRMATYLLLVAAAGIVGIGMAIGVAIGRGL